MLEYPRGNGDVKRRGGDVTARMNVYQMSGRWPERIIALPDASKFCDEGVLSCISAPLIPCHPAISPRLFPANPAKSHPPESS